MSDADRLLTCSVKLKQAYELMLTFLESLRFPDEERELWRKQKIEEYRSKMRETEEAIDYAIRYKMVYETEVNPN